MRLCEMYCALAYVQYILSYCKYHYYPSSVCLSVWCVICKHNFIGAMV